MEKILRDRLNKYKSLLKTHQDSKLSKKSSFVKEEILKYEILIKELIILIGYARNS